MGPDDRSSVDGKSFENGELLMRDDFKDVTEFVNYFLENVDCLLAVPSHTGPIVTMAQNVTALVIYRKGQFQVEMIIVPPNSFIPEHVHPNIDSYEVSVGGGLCLSRNGQWTVRETLDLDPPSPEDPNLNRKRGGAIRVRPGDVHGGCFGHEGAVFYSVQHWLNGVKPTSVAHDYSGKVLGPDHEVKEGMTKYVKDKWTWRDAASKADAPAIITY